MFAGPAGPQQKVWGRLREPPGRLQDPDRKASLLGSDKFLKVCCGHVLRPQEAFCFGWCSGELSVSNNLGTSRAGRPLLFVFLLFCFWGLALRASEAPTQP